MKRNQQDEMKEKIRQENQEVSFFLFEEERKKKKDTAFMVLSCIIHMVPHTGHYLYFVLSR